MLASRALRKEDDESCVDVESGVFFQEIFAVVGDNDVVIGNSEVDQIPVLPTGLSKMSDIVRLIPLGFRNCDQRATQTFIDQEAILQRLAGNSTDRQSAP